MAWRSRMMPVSIGTPSARPPLGTLAVDPRNPQNVYAAPSWEEDDGGLGVSQYISSNTTNGPRVIYISHDRGQSWQAVKYDAGEGYKQVFSIDIDPNNSNLIYLGADNGVYRSRSGGASWKRITTPASSGSRTVYGNTRGATLSPDGRYLFSTYAVGVNTGADRNTSLGYVTQTSFFVADTASFTWHEVSSGLLDTAVSNNLAHFWRPVVDPRSANGQYKVLLGDLAGGNYGLFEGTITIDGSGNVSGSWKKVFENRPNVEPVRNYDIGWNDLQAHVREYSYTPTSWPERLVWMGSQQSVYVGDPNQPSTSWQPRSTKKTGQYQFQDFQGTKTATAYTGTGIASTYNFDMTGYGSYMVQGQADNDILESWDYGATWTQRLSNMTNYLFAVHSNDNFVDSPDNNINWYWINNGDAFLTVPTSPPIVLAGVAAGYGGGVGTEGNGFLMGLQLKNYNPNDSWQFLAGQQWSAAPPFISKYYNNDNPPTAPKGVNGLPGWRIQTMAYDPKNPKRVIVGTYQGLYMCDDIVSLVNNMSGPTGNYFHSIGNAEQAKHNFRYVAFDPNDSNVLYAMSAPFDPNNGYYGKETGEGKVWKGTFDGTNWNWQEIFNKGGPGNSTYDMQVWQNGSQTEIAFTVEQATNNDTALYLSSDQGRNWKKILTAQQATNLKSHTWYPGSGIKLSLNGVAGYGNRVFVTAGSHQYGRAYGVFSGTLQGDGSVQWSDLSGTYSPSGLKFDGGTMSGDYCPFPFARRAYVLNTNGQLYLYLSTTGAGLWRRAL